MTEFPLFNYVNTLDTTWDYYDTGARVNADRAAGAWLGYVLNLTSQTWMNELVISRPVWTHQLVIIVPDDVQYTNTSALYITGGNNDSPSVPKATDEDILVTSVLALETKSIAGALFQVPNAPIVFADDPEHKERSEDAIISFTWVQYMRHQNTPDWVAFNPMVKSAVRALDTMQGFCKEQGLADIQQFLVAGASKRGWTTWLTGAVDKRVIGIAPIVMDLLNFGKSIPHMVEAYGGWTFAFKDYYALNITEKFGTPDMALVEKLIDPLNYKKFLHMPKLVIDSTGDEFFMLDNDHYWWGMLEGETLRLMIDNAEHSMATGIVPLLTGVGAFYQSLLDGSDRPKFSWTIDNDGPNSTGKITVTTNQRPSKAVLRFATTFDNKRRDFRLVKGDTPADPCEFIKVKIFGDACINPVIWIGEDIAPTSVKNGVYTYEGTQPMPDDGKWRGFLIEMYYPGSRGTSFRLTTQVSIIPNTFPFGMPVTGEKGVLV